METVLLAGIVLFSVSSLYFLFSQQVKFNSAFLVSFITLISYIIMYEGSFVTVSEGGDDLYWTRWIFYGLSCSLLMYAISKALKFSNAEMVKLIYLTVIVMFTGALASVYQMEFKWVMFAVSTIAYLIMIYPVVTSKAKSAASILPFIFFGWSVFPIIFLVSPEGLNLIGNPLSAGIYLGLDFLTKIVFYFVVPQRN